MYLSHISLHILYFSKEVRLQNQFWIKSQFKLCIYAVIRILGLYMMICKTSTAKWTLFSSYKTLCLTNRKLPSFLIYPADNHANDDYDLIGEEEYAVIQNDNDISNTNPAYIENNSVQYVNQNIIDPDNISQYAEYISSGGVYCLNNSQDVDNESIDLSTSLLWEEPNSDDDIHQPFAGTEVCQYVINPVLAYELTDTDSGWCTCDYL